VVTSLLAEQFVALCMQKAKKHGLVFSPEAEAKYLQPPMDDVKGQAHDEWKIIPWGIPEHRAIPSVATMSNTVQARLDQDADYAPPNVTMAGWKLSGYSIAQVLPYNDI
jgi:hypothetical protein